MGLASLAYRTMPIPQPSGYTWLQEASPLDWLALLLAFETESLLARSMRHGYVLVQDELPYVRGRIRFDGPANSSLRPGKIQCEFSDFLPDTPENRVLRGTLEVLRTASLLPGLQDQLDGTIDRLTGVLLVALTRQLFDSLRPTRLNQHYGPALDLCRLIFERRGIEYPLGGSRAPGFFFPMEKVFEAAVANYLRGCLSTIETQENQQFHPTSGVPNRSISIRPDILIRGASPQLVVDTKYAAPERTNQFGGLSFRSEDMYQILAYSVMLGCPGVLIYPRDSRDVDVTFELNGNRFTLLTVDLGQPGLGGLDSLGCRISELLGRR